MLGETHFVSVEKGRGKKVGEGFNVALSLNGSSRKVLIKLINRLSVALPPQILSLWTLVLVE